MQATRYANVVDGSEVFQRRVGRFGLPTARKRDRIANQEVDVVLRGVTLDGFDHDGQRIIATQVVNVGHWVSAAQLLKSNTMILRVQLPIADKDAEISLRELDRKPQRQQGFRCLAVA